MLTACKQPGLHQTITLMFMLEGLEISKALRENNSIMLYCAHFYYRHFILVNSDKTPSIKVCTVQHYTIIIKNKNKNKNKSLVLHVG